MSNDGEDFQEKLKNLMVQANFDKQTFLFGLGIIQNKVTDIDSATVREMQDLREGLTTEAVNGKLLSFKSFLNVIIVVRF